MESKMKLSKKEINFLIECLKQNKQNYGEKASKYNDIKGYQKKIFSPKVQEIEDMINKLEFEITKVKD